MASLKDKDTGKIEILLEDGMSKAMAQAPIVVSASRSTDIPAFYSDWFFHRMKVGYSAWTNPFNGVRSYVSYARTRFIVFWSKNPRPLLAHLDELEERGIGCYIQYSLNDYDEDDLNNRDNDNSIRGHELTSQDEIDTVMLLRNIFIYSFIVIITLIGILNMYNAINTNLETRKREVVSLITIGMEGKQIQVAEW